MKGFILLHRELLDWEWYSSIKHTRLFIHLLLNANHKDNKWRGKLIEKGSFLTSLQTLALKTSLGVQTIRTCLKDLKLTHEITYVSTSNYTIITITNYDKYQSPNTPTNNQLTNNQQTTNKQLTTNNKVNKVNKVNNIYIPELIEYYKLKIYNIKDENITNTAINKINSRLNKHSLEILKKAIDKFSNNKWRMEHNSDKGLSWFFRSDAQIDTFLELKEDKEVFRRCE